VAFIVRQESAEFARVEMFGNSEEEALVKLKFGGELASDLPHAVQPL